MDDCSIAFSYCAVIVRHRFEFRHQKQWHWNSNYFHSYLLHVSRLNQGQCLHFLLRQARCYSWLPRSQGAEDFLIRLDHGYIHLCYAFHCSFDWSVDYVPRFPWFIIHLLNASWRHWSLPGLLCQLLPCSGFAAKQSFRLTRIIATSMMRPTTTSPRTVVAAEWCWCDDLSCLTMTTC